MPTGTAGTATPCSIFCVISLERFCSSLNEASRLRSFSAAASCVVACSLSASKVRNSRRSISRCASPICALPPAMGRISVDRRSDGSPASPLPDNINRSDMAPAATRRSTRGAGAGCICATGSSRRGGLTLGTARSRRGGASSAKEGRLRGVRTTGGIVSLTDGSLDSGEARIT